MNEAQRFAATANALAMIDVLTDDPIIRDAVVTDLVPTTPKIFVVEIRRIRPTGSELIKLETDDRQYAEATAALGIHRNHWNLISKNF